MFMSAYVDFDAKVDSDDVELSKEKPIKKSSGDKSQWDLNLNLAMESDYKCFGRNSRTTDEFVLQSEPTEDASSYSSLLLDSDKENNNYFTTRAKVSTQAESFLRRRKTAVDSLSRKVLKAKKSWTSYLRPSSIFYQRTVE